MNRIGVSAHLFVTAFAETQKKITIFTQNKEECSIHLVLAHASKLPNFPPIVLTTKVDDGFALI